MSLVKICGLRRECDIDYVNKYKPDYIGFVFFKGKRYVSPEQAIVLRKKLDKDIKAIGVFVNEPMEFILDLCNNEVIDIIQLHGDENNNYIKELKSKTNKPVIKAVRVQTTEQIIQADKMDCDYLLLDTYSKTEYGGIGKSFKWNIIPKINKPFFLAGGLNLENVSKAIKEVNPYCVDVSSGVETNGFKDENKIKAVIEKVRRTI